MSADDRPLTVNPWRRYGQQRLYVNDADGAAVGWLDLRTGDRHLRQPERSAEFERAVAEWQAEVGEPVPAVGGSDPQDVEAAVEPPVPGVGGSDPADVVGAAGQPPAAPPVDPPSTPPAGLAVEVDLARNRPGAKARARALEERRARPIVTRLARARRIHNDERAWRIGAKGETLVARQLAPLARRDPSWHVLHALAVGTQGADIDHLVIGPGGVYCLNTKNHPRAAVWVARSTFLVNGQFQPYVRNSRHEARRTSRLLSQAAGIPVAVLGVIVVVNAASLMVREEPEDVAVVGRIGIREWLAARPRSLGPVEVEQLFDAARRETTWFA